MLTTTQLAVLATLHCLEDDPISTKEFFARLGQQRLLERPVIREEAETELRETYLVADGTVVITPFGALQRARLEDQRHADMDDAAATCGAGTPLEEDVRLYAIA